MSILDLAGQPGLDANTLKAYLVRGGSASAAISAGQATYQIMNAADWSSEFVFKVLLKAS